MPVWKCPKCGKTTDRPVDSINCFVEWLSTRPTWYKPSNLSAEDVVIYCIDCSKARLVDGEPVIDYGVQMACQPPTMYTDVE